MLKYTAMFSVDRRLITELNFLNSRLLIFFAESQDGCLE